MRCKMINKVSKSHTSILSMFQDFTTGELVIWLILSIARGNTQSYTLPVTG